MTLKAGQERIEVCGPIRFPAQFDLPVRVMTSDVEASLGGSRQVEPAEDRE